MDDIFEWDIEKAEVNLKKHGVSFDEAISVFLGSFVNDYSGSLAFK
jgi:uncharacterized DUF497 family protein